jgi:hypothetical protein
MSEFITIKQASEITGKHPDTIRHLIRKNKGSKHVTKDSKGRVLINIDLLSSEYDLQKPSTQEATEQLGASNVKEPTTDTIKPPQNDLKEVLQALTNQLEAKDKQIFSLQQIIHEKESNTTKLQDQFQQLLARQQLPQSTSDNLSENLTKPDTQVSKKRPSKSPVKSKQSSKKVRNQTTSKPQATKKKSWWRRG